MPGGCHPCLVGSNTYELLGNQGMEDWPFVDERELMPFKGAQSCSTCQNFGYITLGQCQVLGACRLKECLLPPGVQLIRRCKGWSHATPWAMRQNA